jgi:ABC-2 type transport system ATP-binding protein
MTSDAIWVQGLTKRFRDVAVVDNVSFAVPRGGATALLGANGAGKTTTLSMLLGILLPTSGTIEMLGENMQTHRHLALPRVNFSSPYIDLPHRLTVRENLTVYGRLYSVPNLRARIESLSHDLDFTAFLDRSFGSLSAGQKTRISIAKALINSPELLLLDEPTASLDPDSADWVRAFLSDYRSREGATLLLASHNMTEVERMCDDVIIMKGGRVVDTGSPPMLLDRYGRTTLEEVFLDIARDRDGPTQATNPGR